MVLIMLRIARMLWKARCRRIMDGLCRGCAVFQAIDSCVINEMIHHMHCHWVHVVIGNTEVAAAVLTLENIFWNEEFDIGAVLKIVKSEENFEIMWMLKKLLWMLRRHMFNAILLLTKSYE